MLQEQHLPTAEHQASCREGMKWQMKELMREGQREVCRHVGFRVGAGRVSRKTFKISYLSSRDKLQLQDFHQ